VLALVFCSLLVPIAFLFNRFPAGEFSAADTFAPTPRDATRLEPPRIRGNAGAAAASPPIGSAPFPADLFRGLAGSFLVV
jgi:hypothetical protein